MASDVAETVKGAFSFLSERGVLGGLYIGCLSFGIVLGNGTLDSEYVIWVLGLCAVFGLIIANITYELLLPLFRLVTNWLVLRGCHATIPLALRAGIADYRMLRRFRETYLSSAGSSPHLVKRITKDESLRQTLTFFASSSLVSYAILFFSTRTFSVARGYVTAEYAGISYVLLASLVGQVQRSLSYGRAIGFALLNTQPPQ